MNKSNNYAVIMAGGIGSRFWPMSKSSFPKQFIDILGTGESLIQQTYNRLSKICPVENILVVTNSKYKKLCRDQLPLLKQFEFYGFPLNLDGLDGSPVRALAII